MKNESVLLEKKLTPCKMVEVPNTEKNLQFRGIRIERETVKYNTVTTLIIENAPNLRTVILGEIPNLVQREPSCLSKSELISGHSIQW